MFERASRSVQSAREDKPSLHEYLSSNRTALIERCLSKAAQRAAPKTTDEPILYGIPLFLDQIVKTLVEQTSEPMQSRLISGLSGGGTSTTSEFGATAPLHAHKLLRRGYIVEQSGKSASQKPP
jgi:hypothetical protein